MTSLALTISKAQSASRTKIAILANPLIQHACMALIFAIVILMTYYILQANLIAAYQYQIKLINDKMISAQELNARLNTDLAGLLSPTKLSSFAAQRQMVPAGDTVYLFTNGNVALK